MPPEDPRTHKMLMPEAGGEPAWKERYTIKHLTDRIGQIGYRNAMRQFYHQHIEEGHVFTESMIRWTRPLPLNRYDYLLSYNDPSWKGTTKNDFKAIVLIGKTGVYYHVLWAWIRQTTPTVMVEAHYLVDAMTREAGCQHYMEAGLMQDQHIDNYVMKGEETGSVMAIRPDTRKKPDKADRIADLEPLFQLGLIMFNEKERDNPDMQRLIEQLLGFPFGHDDGPDALEGGVYLLKGKTRSSRFQPITGNYQPTHRKRG